jgi:hypothetical protein
VIGAELGTINTQLYAVTLIANRISALGLIGSAITAVRGMTIIETVAQNAALNAQVKESCTIRAG